MNPIAEFVLGAVLMFFMMAFAMLFYIGVFYLLFKIKGFSKVCNSTFASGIITLMLTAHTLLFVGATATLLFYSDALLQSTFVFSTYSFCFFAALYFNQTEVNEGKTMLVGTGIMSCVAMGAYYCGFNSMAFLEGFISLSSPQL